MKGKLIVGMALGVMCAPFFVAAEASTNANTNDGIEEKVREYFPNAPVMADIARCESKFRQFHSPGNPLAGGYGGNMIGLFQINAPVHAAYATGLGMNIYTLEGNMAYAKLLYDEEGTRPWRSSKSCWENSNAAADDAEEIARLLKIIAELTVQLETLKAKLALSAR